MHLSMSPAGHHQLRLAITMCAAATLSLVSCSDKKTESGSGDLQTSSQVAEGALSPDLVDQFFYSVEQGNFDEAITALEAIGGHIHWAEDGLLSPIQFALNTPPQGAPNEHAFDYISVNSELLYRLASNRWAAFVSKISSIQDKQRCVRLLKTTDLLLKQVMLSHSTVDPKNKGSWPITAAALYRAGIRQKLALITPDDPKRGEWESEVSVLSTIAQRKVVDDVSIVP